MSTLSKLVHLPPLFNQRLNHLQLDLNNTSLTRLLLLANGKNAVVNIVRHGGHERIFRRRQGQLINNRIKDGWQFYYIALGILPCFIVTTLTHIFYGSSCELMEYPKDGEKPPHHWQFERTPLRQFYSKYIFPTDIQYHEGWCSRFSNWQIKDRWRRIEHRVKHLIRERQDYKAYHYHPVTNEWQDLARRRAWRAQNNYFEAESTAGTDVR